MRINPLSLFGPEPFVGADVEYGARRVPVGSQTFKTGEHLLVLMWKSLNGFIDIGSVFEGLELNDDVGEVVAFFRRG